MVSILDVSMLEGALNMSLDHSISQIKIANMEKTTNGCAMECSHEQLTDIRRFNIKSNHSPR